MGINPRKDCGSVRIDDEKQIMAALIFKVSSESQGLKEYVCICWNATSM